MSNFNFPGADKIMSRMFRRADGVVWDLMTGKIGDTPVLVIDAYGKQVTVEPKHLPQLVTEQVGIPVRYISRGPTCDDVNTI